MKEIALLVAIVSLLSYRVSLADDGQIHWLIGRWDGTIEGPNKSHRRTLRVIDVAPGSEAQAMFGEDPKKLPGAKVMVEGTKVQIVTVVKNEVELTRQGDDSLVGTFTATKERRQFPITLNKLKPSAEFDGQWEGKAYTRPCPQARGTNFFSRANCQLTIRNSLITGKGVFSYFDSDHQVWFQWRTITGHVDSDGFGVLVQTPFNLVNPGGAADNLLGTFTGTEFRASQTRGLCAYDVNLMRK